MRIWGRSPWYGQKRWGGKRKVAKNDIGPVGWCGQVGYWWTRPCGHPSAGCGWFDGERQRSGWGVGMMTREALASAASWGEGDEECRTCRGSGKVYPQETVEKIAKLVYEHGDFMGGPIDAEAFVIVLLDALGET